MKRAALILMSQHELWTRELDRWTQLGAEQIQERISDIAPWRVFAERLTQKAVRTGYAGGD